MRRTFSLIEFVVVMVLITILALLVVPRFSRAAPGTDDTGLRANLTMLRCAIERYYYDHGAYPGQKDDGVHAAGTAPAFLRQLTKFTDENGDVADVHDPAHHFGPYLRAGLPPCTVPPRIGCAGVVIVGGTPRFVESATDAGWVYNCQTGSLVANSNLIDAEGLAYERY